MINVVTPRLLNFLILYTTIMQHILSKYVRGPLSEPLTYVVVYFVNYKNIIYIRIENIFKTFNQ